MSDLPWAGTGFTPEDHELYRTRMTSGRCHIGIDPPLEDDRTWYSASDDRVLAIMGAHGLTDPSEIPVRDDYSEDVPACQRCGGTEGVEIHHVAPREFFGKETAEEYPKVALCPDCHEEFHDVLEEGQRQYWRDITRQSARFLVLQLRDPRPWRELFEIWCHTKDLPSRDRDRIYDIVRSLLHRKDGRHRPQVEVHTCDRCGADYTGDTCPRCEREDRKGGHVQ